MRELDFDARFPGGGRADSGGSLYHLSFRSGSRASGSSACAAYEYIAREGAYDSPERDEALHVESGHMSAWAQDDPRTFWDAADLHERVNGRLYVAGDFALPRELDEQDQIELAREFVDALTHDENLPYTFAVHAGRDNDGQAHNPHVHVMISERQNDRIERSAERWFARANRRNPDRGGALKSRTFHGREWVERARATLAEFTNRKLEQRDSGIRVDHRSYEQQGSAREPGQHFGPSAPHVVERGLQHDRLEEALAVAEYPAALADLDRRIEQLEAAREAIAQDDGRDLDDPNSSGRRWGGTPIRDSGSRGR